MNATPSSTFAEAAPGKQAPVRNGAVLQRQCACGQHAGGGECEECRKKRTLQRSPLSSRSVTGAPAIVDDVLRAPGHPLDPAIRSRMETRFGHDFSDVRVHTDSRAARSAEAVAANAYTVGRNVVFGDGRYAPGSHSGERLLAHELAHVVQQSGNGPARGNEGSLESEAEAASARIMNGGPVGALSSVPAGGLQREAASGAPAQARREVPRSPSPIEFREGNSRFHASLTRGPVCALEVTLRVKFNFIDQPYAWVERDKERWRNDFMRVVSNRWSFRHMIVPSSECSGEPCRAVPVHVRVVEAASDFHYEVNIVSSQVGTARVERSVGGGSRAVLGIDSNEPQEHFDFRQSQSEHEAGHMLGLPHIHCSSNSPACYGVTRTDRADIMGEGSMVSVRDYEVFARVMKRLSPACDWEVRRPPGYVPEGLGESGLGMFLGALGGALLGGIAGFLIGGPIGAGIGMMLGSLVGAGAGMLVGHYAR